MRDPNLSQSFDSLSLASPNPANNNNNGNTNPTTNEADLTFFYDPTTELADLGRARFDHDTAAIGDRDSAFFAQQPVHVRQGRAAAGREAEVFAWNTARYTMGDINEREELKGDLHGGQLHRQNRAARMGPELEPQPYAGRGGGGYGRGGGGGGRGGRGGRGGGPVAADSLCAGRKPPGDVPPLAKGYAEELSGDLFFKDPIV